MLKNLHLNETGLRLFVGSLEQTLMLALWEQDQPITMAKLYRYLVQNNITEVSYSTIITTLTRMSNKQLVIRTQRDNSTPLWSKAFENEDHFIEVCMIDTLSILRENYAEHFLGYIGVS